MVKLAWDREAHLDLNLNEEPMEVHDVNDQPRPIVKLSQAHEYAQVLSDFAVEHSPKFLVADVMNMQPFHE